MHLVNTTSVEDSTILKLLKIKNLSENAGTREEAFTAAEQLQRLLFKHKLELSDLEAVRIETDEPVEEEYLRAEGFGFKLKRKRVEWLEDLADRVAKAHCCDTLIITGSNTQVFVGRKSDRAVAIKSFTYLANVAQELAELEAKEYSAKFERLYEGHRPDARVFKNSFLRGFVNEIGNRLCKQKREIEKEQRLREEQETAAKRESLFQEKFNEEAPSRIEEIVNQKLAEISEGDSSLIDELYTKAEQEVKKQIKQEIQSIPFSSALMVIKNSEQAVKDFFEKGRKSGSIKNIVYSGYSSSHNSAGYHRGKERGGQVSLSGNVMK